MAWWRWRVSAVSRSAVCSLTSLRVFAWLQSAAGRGPARRTESWYSNISPCLFSLFTPGSTTAIYLLSDCSDLQGDSHDKKLWGCEPRLFDFDRKILSQEELWRERRSERSENVNIFPDNFEICEKEWSSGLDQEIHHPSLLGGALPVKCLRLMEKFYILKSILFSILWVFYIEWIILRLGIKIYYISNCSNNPRSSQTFQISSLLWFITETLTKEREKNEKMEDIRKK